MPDPPEQPRKPAPPPGGYLPRIAKFSAPIEEESVSGSPKKRSKEKARKAASKPEEGNQGTPTLETHQGRRRVRIAIGAAAGATIALSVFVLLWTLTRGDSRDDDTDLPDEGQILAASGEDGERIEREGQDLLRRAHQMASGGRSDQALRFLERVGKEYPKTRAATDAHAAVERSGKGLPLFVDGPAVVAEDIGPKPDPPREPPLTVVAAPAVAETPSSPVEVIRPTTPLGPPAPSGSSLPGAGILPRVLPPGFHSRPETRVHALGWPLEIFGERDGSTLMFVPGGSFLMGRDDGGATAEKPSHRVNLSAFYMDQHEVTLDQFARFGSETGHPSPPVSTHEKGVTPPSLSGDHPVVLVTYTDAAAYAAWAGKRLPTEAQWEMAARTPDGRLHPWGSGPPAWEAAARPPHQIDRIYSYPTDMSPYGVFDLAGNAWEWTSDWFDVKYYRQTRGPVDDPVGPSRSPSRPPERAVRGGSKDWHSTWRTGMKVDTRLPHLGFRCALPVEPAPAANPLPGTAEPASSRPSRGVIPF